MISVENYRKIYGQTTAVDGLSFEVHPGEVLGLVGPNGAGKTTTIRALTGIIPATEGRLAIAGYDLQEQPIEAKQRLALIPDEPKLFDLLTVEEHLLFTARVYGVPEIELYGRMNALLATFKLEEKRKTPAQELSRGMRQKVAICCAFLHDPPVLFFDEPLTGLDPLAIRDLKRAIRDRAAAGATVLISSHLLSLVEDLCTHLLILVRGRSRYFGPIGNVRDQFVGIEGDLEAIFLHATEEETTAKETT
jgi:ABC-2 type transport system ATP-binding protein